LWFSFCLEIAYIVEFCRKGKTLKRETITTVCEIVGLAAITAAADTVNIGLALLVGGLSLLIIGIAAGRG
jgi:ammonia channel protein AmtB